MFPELVMAGRRQRTVPICLLTQTAAANRKDRFFDQGYLAPLRLFSRKECRRFLRAANVLRTRPPLDWPKGLTATSRAYYEIATQPAIVEVVAELLGDDIMLWGAKVIRRRPNAVHPWHSDIESSMATGKTVSVWLGLKSVTQKSSLSLIPYSHQFGITVQQATHQAGKSRREVTDQEVTGWARDHDGRSQIVVPELHDGEAVFFDGRLWHASRNKTFKTRTALLLQYTTPDAAIRMPDTNDLGWPIQQITHPKPPCIMIRGTDINGVNRMVSAPVAGNPGEVSQLTNRIQALRLTHAAQPPGGWKPYHIFRGATADLKHLTCHESVLSQDQCPHPPHRHSEEELLILLAGEVDLILPDHACLSPEPRLRLQSGQLVYYPAHFRHTLQTVSDQPAHYLMFKWRAALTEAKSPLAFGQFPALDPAEGLERRKGFRTRLIFEGQTRYLRKLHCHASTLAPGAGYDQHVDAYDVAIVLLEGQLETLGERVQPQSVIFYSAGVPHGMYNPGHTAARYLVFEFHGSQAANAEAFPPRLWPLIAKLGGLRRWKRRLGRTFVRLSGRSRKALPQNKNSVRRAA